MGEKLYAAMAAMRFAANPPMLLWRVCSIWTMFFNLSFIVSINNLSPVEFYRVDASTSSLCSCVCEWSGEGKKRKTAGARWGLRWGQVHFRKRLLVVGGALQGLDKPKDGSEQQKTLHQTKTKVWNIKSSVLQKDCLILHLSVTLRAQNATQNSKKRGLLLSVQEKVVPLHS